ncbi:unnamed protein product [Trichogramma brassicae]|uniref:Uncharacterized protein n=1 Tax=Trichogramma brassicae TaxID=86971 RepID=A0A6H5ITF0_9HYME|nr:unnamed protein product [Trichogramma brassicae]
MSTNLGVRSLERIMLDALAGVPYNLPLRTWHWSSSRNGNSKLYTISIHAMPNSIFDKSAQRRGTTTWKPAATEILCRSQIHLVGTTHTETPGIWKKNCQNCSHWTSRLDLIVVLVVVIGAIVERTCVPQSSQSTIDFELVLAVIVAAIHNTYNSSVPPILTSIFMRVLECVK